MKKLKKVDGEMIEVEDEDNPNIKYSLVDLADVILQMEDQRPSRRKEKIAFREWKGKINKMIKEYNDLCGYKCFHLIN